MKKTRTVMNLIITIVIALAGIGIVFYALDWANGMIWNPVNYFETENDVLTLLSVAGIIGLELAMAFVGVVLTAYGVFASFSNVKDLMR